MSCGQCACLFFLEFVYVCTSFFGIRCVCVCACACACACARARVCVCVCGLALACERRVARPIAMRCVQYLVRRVGVPDRNVLAGHFGACCVPGAPTMPSSCWAMWACGCCSAVINAAVSLRSWRPSAHANANANTCASHQYNGHGGTHASHAARSNASLPPRFHGAARCHRCRHCRHCHQCQKMGATEISPEISPSTWAADIDVRFVTRHWL